MTITLNNTPALKGRLLRPLEGAWWAHLVLALGAKDGGPAPGDSVVLDLGGVEYRGTVQRAGSEGGLYAVSVVGGRGRLGQNVQPKTYQSMPAGSIFRDILQEIGEEPGQVQNEPTMPQWVRLGGPVIGALAALARSASASWWIGADGAVNLGQPGWDAVGPEGPVLEEGVGWVRYGMEPSLSPGTTLTGYGRVVEVQWVWAPHTAYTEVRYEPA